MQICDTPIISRDTHELIQLKKKRCNTLELPEALTIAKQMNEVLKGKMIERAHLTNCDYLIRMRFVNLAPKDFEARLIGKSIDSVTAGGKWIFAKLKPDMHLLLGEITGRVLYHTSQDTIPAKYNLKLDFGDDTYLTVGIRFLGFILAVTDEELRKRKYPGDLGLSPVDDKEFTFENFNNILSSRSNENIKSVITTRGRENIAGIGNSYLQEILFKAKIHPKRKVKDLSEKERIDFYTAIKETLNEAIRLGGRETEYDLYNNPGGYKSIIGAHMKGKPCPKCGTSIEKLNVMGSSSYVCPSCQR